MRETLPNYDKLLSSGVLFASLLPLASRTTSVVETLSIHLPIFLPEYEMMIIRLILYPFLFCISDTSAFLRPSENNPSLRIYSEIAHTSMSIEE